MGAHRWRCTRSCSQQTALSQVHGQDIADRGTSQKKVPVLTAQGTDHNPQRRRWRGHFCPKLAQVYRSIYLSSQIIQYPYQVCSRFSRHGLGGNTRENPKPGKEPGPTCSMQGQRTEVRRRGG